MECYKNVIFHFGIRIQHNMNIMKWKNTAYGILVQIQTIQCITDQELMIMNFDLFSSAKNKSNETKKEVKKPEEQIFVFVWIGQIENHFWNLVIHFMNSNENFFSINFIVVVVFLFISINFRPQHIFIFFAQNITIAQILLDCFTV